MAAPAPAQAREDAPDRRQFLLALGVVFGVVVVLIAIYVAFSPDTHGKGLTKQEQIDAASTHAPRIIPTPAEGRAPENPGDPGGWEQLALFGLILGGMATCGGLAWRSSRRAKRRLAASQTT